jgi:hypothetical protein
VEEAMKGMRNKKITGNDEVPGHVLKLLIEDGHRIMTQHEPGGWPKDITDVKMTAFKKPEARQNASTTTQSASPNIQQR